MNKISRISLSIIILLTLIIFSTVYASELPQVEILGSKYYVYETKKGDTFFNIASAQNWDDQELQRLNPGVASPFKKGTKLYYPVETTSTDTVAAEVITTAPVRELTHVVGKGETIYSISQLYSIPLDKIYKLNPSSRRGVKVGDILVLREAGNETDRPEYAAEVSEKPERNYYVVGNDETLRKVANDNEVSVKSILEANPGVSQTTFKEGEKIILPEKGTGIETRVETHEKSRFDHFEEYQVMEGDTWSSIAEKYDVSAQDLQSINPKITVLKTNQIISVPRLEKYNVEQTVTTEDPRQTTYFGVNEIYNDIHKVADTAEKRVIKYAIISETPAAKKDVEFIRGFLTGIDQLKHDPYKIELKVIDGTSTGEEIITALDEYHPTLVFITADKNIPSYLIEYASVSQTPLVNTFEVKSEEFTTNPYFIQLMTPSNYFNDCVASNAYEAYPGYNLIFVGEPDENDQLASALKKFWDSVDVRNISTESLQDLNVNPFEKLLFYNSCTKKEDVSNFLNKIAEIQSNNLTANISVLGRPNWIVYADNLKESLQKTNTSIPSRFYIDYNSYDYQQFLKGYKDLFQRNPVKSLPLYAAVGYDNAMYFTKSLEKSSLDFNKFEPSDNTIQTQFDLKRISNWSGFVNLPVYLIKYSPDSETSFVVIE